MPSKPLNKLSGGGTLQAAAEAVSGDPQASQGALEELFTAFDVHDRPFTITNWAGSPAVCLFDSEDGVRVALAAWGEPVAPWTVSGIETGHALVDFLDDLFHRGYYYATLDPPLNKGSRFRVFGTRNLAEHLRCEMIPNGPN